MEDVSDMEEEKIKSGLNEGFREEEVVF